MFNGDQNPQIKKGTTAMKKFMLNETSYHGAGAILAITDEIKARGFKKVFVATDPDLIKFGIAAKVTDLLDKEGIVIEGYETGEALIMICMAVADEPGTDDHTLCLGDACDLPTEAIELFCIPIPHVLQTAAIYNEEAVIRHFQDKHGACAVPPLGGVRVLSCGITVIGIAQRVHIYLCFAVSRAAVGETAEGIRVGIHDQASLVAVWGIVGINHIVFLGGKIPQITVLIAFGIGNSGI
jgi:hypothetical protein